MDYLVAPCISNDETAYLKILIEEHHIQFVQLYPDASIIPKLHYLIHASRLISKKVHACDIKKCVQPCYTNFTTGLDHFHNSRHLDLSKHQLTNRR